MRFIKIKSYAKINIALNIIGKTPFLHKIESIIAFVSLHDDIFIKKIKMNKHKISFYGRFSKNISQRNTIYKLLRILEKKKILNDTKFQIKINKKIPNKAGLAGGSMNAANLLAHFIKKKIIKITNKETIEVCKLIGSDVILGLNPTTSILTSDGKVRNFPKLKKIYTIIVKPKFGCSTKDIYLKVNKFDKPQFNRLSKKMLNFNFLKKLKNSLEPIVLSKYPQLRKIKFDLEKLSNSGFARMTGSGSAIVAYFQSKEKCDYVKKQFNKKYKNYWCIASKTI